MGYLYLVHHRTLQLAKNLVVVYCDAVAFVHIEVSIDEWDFPGDAQIFGQLRVLWDILPPKLGKRNGRGVLLVFNADIQMINFMRLATLRI